MKLTCSQTDLSKGLATVGRALSSRATLPVLSCVHMSAGSGCLQLSATNLEIGITCDLPATIEEAGSIALPARLLTDFVNSLPAGTVTIDSPGEPFIALIVGQRSQAHIHGMNPGEYPSPDNASEGDVLYRFEVSALKEAITQVAFAAAADDSRPVLTAVLLHGHEDRVTLAAADAFRLAVRDVPFVASGGEPIETQLHEDLLIPAKTLTELARILPSEGLVSLNLLGNGHQACFQTEHLKLTTRLIEGDFPNYTRIIPMTQNMHAVIETAAFRAAVKAISLFARASANITRLHLTTATGQEPGALTIEASSEDLGDTVSTLEASIEGEAMTLIFNAAYLQDILAAIPTSEVVLESGGATRPGVFHPVGASAATYVVMPMHMNR